MKSEFVFVFFFFFTFGHSVSVRDDGLRQNDQFNFLQFVYFCVIMKQNSLTIQVFTVAHRCTMNLRQRVLLCVICSAIFICGDNHHEQVPSPFMLSAQTNPSFRHSPLFQAATTWNRFVAATASGDLPSARDISNFF